MSCFDLKADGERFDFRSEKRKFSDETRQEYRNCENLWELECR